MLTNFKNKIKKLERMEIFDANVGLLIQLVKEEIKKTAF